MTDPLRLGSTTTGTTATTKKGEHLQTVIKPFSKGTESNDLSSTYSRSKAKTIDDSTSSSSIHRFDCLESVDLLQYVRENNNTTTFPEKLMLLLMYVEREVAKKGIRPEDESVGWVDNGNAFVIRDEEHFVSTWLPPFFGRTKFSSFTRKLYRWGWRKANHTIELSDAHNSNSHGININSSNSSHIGKVPKNSATRLPNRSCVAGKTTASAAAATSTTTLTNNKSNGTGSSSAMVPLYFSNENFRRDNKNLLSKMRSVTASKTRNAQQHDRLHDFGAGGAAGGGGMIGPSREFMQLVQDTITQEAVRTASLANLISQPFHQLSDQLDSYWMEQHRRNLEEEATRQQRQRQQEQLAAAVVAEQQAAAAAAAANRARLEREQQLALQQSIATLQSLFPAANLQLLQQQQQQGPRTGTSATTALPTANQRRASSLLDLLNLSRLAESEQSTLQGRRSY